MERSKTDSKKEGSEFVLTKGKIGKVSVTELVRWYCKSLGDISEEAYIFPVFRGGGSWSGSGRLLLLRQDAAQQGEGAAGSGQGHVALRAHRGSYGGFQERGLQECHHAGRRLEVIGCRLLHQGGGCGGQGGGCLAVKS